MPSRTYTTEEIVKYLLGELPEAEADSLERAYFEDSTQAGTVTEIENDLIDDYIRRQLPSNQRARFEQHYLTHPNRRRRVEEAKVLLLRLDQLKKSRPASSEKRLWWQSMLAFMPGRVLACVCVIAVFLLALGGLRLWRKNNQLRQQIAALEIARSDDAERIRDLAQQTAPEHQGQDQSAARAEQPPAQPSALPAHSKALSKVPVLILAIGAMRRERSEGKSEETSSQLQQITSKDKEVHLILKMRETDYQSYRAEIWTDAGQSEKIFSTSNKVRPKRQAGVETVVVKVPTASFKKGLSSYRVQLTAIAPSGRERSISPAPFRIEKR